MSSCGFMQAGREWPGPPSCASLVDLDVLCACMGESSACLLLLDHLPGQNISLLLVFLLCVCLLL